MLRSLNPVVHPEVFICHVKTVISKRLTPVTPVTPVRQICAPKGQENLAQGELEFTLGMPLALRCALKVALESVERSRGGLVRHVPIVGPRHYGQSRMTFGKHVVTGAYDDLKLF